MDKRGWLFLLPMFVLFLAIYAWPFVYSVWLSLFEVGLLGRQWVGVDNYLTVVRGNEFKRIIWNTVKYWVCIVPFAVFVPLVVAWLVEDLPVRIRGLVRGMFYLPAAVGGVVLVVVWKWVFHPTYGFANWVLSLFGQGPVSWLGDPALSLPSIALVYFVSVSLSNFVLVYCSALTGLPANILDAAAVDGAGSWMIFRKMIVPLMRPAMGYVALTTTLTAWAIWVYVKMLTEGGPMYASTSFGFWIYRTAFVERRFGLASAMAVVMFGATLGIVVALSRRLLRGEQ